MFGKNYQKMLFDKVECLANIYKSGGLSCKLPKKNKIYINIYVLITSLYASYGHNIFSKISQ